ncbi:MAG: hypothetical protein PHE04_06795 [Bacteroidales bacterium]|nr:hypothetical protein [Bacteroidales bacterium]MDD3430882.1 hypothetical protein [Bacteroidales bacterium]MDD4361284.1 hypothetical protein [Bacteroidales bacterium]MDD4430014.1 hypothetical protein [Bacteroidales bacterium]
MKTRYIFILMLLLTACLLPAQSQEQGEMLPEERYTRNSASIVRLEYGDSYDPEVAAFINNARLGGRFDINDIALQALKIDESRTFYPEGSSLPKAPDRTELISTMLNGQKAGQQIVAYIFNRQADGSMNLDRVFERGEYSAHDVDMRLSGTLKVETVRDAGSQLIGRSYLMVYDVTNLRKEYSGEGDSRELYWKATSALYLFKLNWDEQDLDTFYDKYWLDENTPAEEKQAKKDAFEAWNIPVELVSRVNLSDKSISTGIEANKRMGVLGDKKKTDEQRLSDAFAELHQQICSDLNYKIEKQHEDFVVTTPITSLRPIRAKIGTKEDVRHGLRFYAYGFKGNSDGSIKLVRKGILRATKNIADNRIVATGESPESEFTKIAGYGRVVEGLTLVEKKDLNLSIGVGFNSIPQGIAVSGGFHADLSYENHTRKGFCAYTSLALNIDGSAMNGILSYGYGLRIPNFEIYPFAGVGIDAYSFEGDDAYEDSDLNAYLLQGGLRAQLNIFYPVYLFWNVSYNTVFLKGSVYESLEGVSNSLGDFRDMNGTQTALGVRFCF